MNITLKKSSLKENSSITISGSKSESNRLLILQKCYSELVIENLSDSKDTQVLIQALQNNNHIIDVHHAGTAMRFLTAYFAFKTKKEIILTGSERMQQRPIKLLVDALCDLGAQIRYLKNEGFPPLKIKPSTLCKNRVAIDANVSSQYISALLLIAPSLPCGLTICLESEATSKPYLQMTLKLMHEIGVKTSWQKNLIDIKPLKDIGSKTLTVASDWSSASYYYSFIALSSVGSCIELNHFTKDSLQGDACLVNLYEGFGVQTTYLPDKKIIIKKNTSDLNDSFSYDLNDAPDIAQTILVSALGLKKKIKISGLHTLKIKETDRLEAMKNELEKFGAIVKTDNNSIEISSYKTQNRTEPIRIKTYEDHRMAMAFSPLCLVQTIEIEAANVVEKSYLNFWKDLKTIGVKVHQEK